ncbi:ATP synthase subunit delta [Rhynchospora pubera]|uniref:ATP synthase subunit delta n=1 Tax=Rhynchospora pubera TaxID=906938 RepID=A0AAV8FGW0_9POAL|nr:ATP synthase subunit delta [Rhynchospora pubera]
MALHLFQPLPSKPPLPPIPTVTSFLGLGSSTALPNFSNKTNGLIYLEIRAVPSTLQIRQSATRPPGYRTVRNAFTKEPNIISLSSPPSSREEAITQAKTCLAATLQKSLRNTVPFPNKKMKKQKQPRYRVEIPLIDDSPESVVQLAFDVFSDLNVKRKDSKPTLLLLWPSPTLEEMANKTFSKSQNAVVNSQLEESQLDKISTITDEVNPKPVILFNPKWAFEDEKDFNRRAAAFLESFDVVYSFTGLEVQGFLNSRKGVVLRCVRDGKASGEPWLVMVQEGDKEEMKVVTRFTKRPSIGEVETVLYNLMAANSPLTKSVKSVSDFVKNVTKKFT